MHKPNTWPTSRTTSQPWFSDVDVLQLLFQHRRRHEVAWQDFDRDPVRKSFPAHGMAGQRRVDFAYKLDRAIGR